MTISNPVSNTKKTPFLSESVFLVMALWICAAGLVALIYPHTTQEMISIWIRSETFSHCFFVLPAALYLLWVDKIKLSAPVQHTWWLALLLIPFVVFWVASSLGGIAAFQQLALVIFLVVSCAALTGLPIIKKSLFPLLFLFLMVPVGEELVPAMIEFTADFTVGALRLMKFPVFREGSQFSLPSGNWSVVEACSGVRYLIASVTIGLLYAHLTYQRWYKKALFILLSLVIPIIANGLRAVMIVLLGHFSGMTIATGVDHLIYGWLFFGLVIFLMFWVGNFWRDNPPTIAQSDSGSDFKWHKQSFSFPQFLSTIAVLGAILLIGPVWLAYIAQKQEALGENYESVTDFSDVSLCETCSSDYVPGYLNMDIVVREALVFESEEMKGVPLYFYKAVYQNGGQKGELINSENRIANRTDENNSYVIEQSSKEILPGVAITRTLVGGRTRMLVYSWTTVDGDRFKSGLKGKWLEVKKQFALEPFYSDFSAVYTPVLGAPSSEADKRLTQFISVNRDKLQLKDNGDAR